MMAIPYCGSKSGQAPPGTMSTVRYQKGKLGDDTFYVLEGLDKSDQSEKISGRALWKVNEGSDPEL
jgi:hypothetical protein